MILIHSDNIVKTTILCFAFGKSIATCINERESIIRRNVTYVFGKKQVIIFKSKFFLNEPIIIYMPVDYSRKEIHIRTYPYLYFITIELY